MKEPTDSADPQAWQVWADFLFDQGRHEEETRARHISQALTATEGKLWLWYGESVSLLCLPSQRLKTSRHFEFADAAGYHWEAQPPRNIRPKSTYSPFCPLDFKPTFTSHTGKIILTKYWDTLARLGARSAVPPTNCQGET